MDELHKASVATTGLRDSVVTIADDVSQLATKKFGMDATAAQALDSASEHLAKAKENLIEAAKQLATADSRENERKQKESKLKRPPPG